MNPQKDRGRPGGHRWGGMRCLRSQDGSAGPLPHLTPLRLSSMGSLIR